MKITVVLISFLSLPWILCKDYDEEPVNVSCEDRCLRIHERSLDRMGFSKVSADKYIDKPKSDAQILRGVCWKQYDFFYCMKGCTKSIEHEKYSRHVKSRCKHAVEDLDVGLSCLFKYRSFLEIRCSSFLNEAIRLKQTDDPDLLPDKETCRYLHLNALCLENSVSSFCPQATPFFRRLNLRDFFLNHILPADDNLFDDEDLDSCQLKDFVKEALDVVKVSPRREDDDSALTTTPRSTTSRSLSLSIPSIDEDDEDDEDDDSEESWPMTMTPPAIVRTLSPSSRGHSPIQTSTTSNFVYTTPTRKLASSTLVGTLSTPIHITKEQAMRTSTSRGGLQRGHKITVTPKLPSTDSTISVTSALPSTTSRRRVFDSDEDFTQTPPNFLWGSFRGENYKLARNYSESFPPNEQFVTPITIESSSLFGDDDDSGEDEDYGSPQVIDIDREPVTVTGKPVKMTTIVNLIGSKNANEKSDEDRSSSPVYEHAVDTQLQHTTHHSRPVPIDYEESTTAVTIFPKAEDDWTTVSKILPTDYEEDLAPSIDENDIKTEEEINEKRDGIHHKPSSSEKGIEDVPSDEEKKEAENNFERALQFENEKYEESNEIEGEKVNGEEPPNLKPTADPTKAPENFTPLINGGRVAVKSIKEFKDVGDEESAQDWTEDSNLDDSHVDLSDVDDYDKEVYLTSEIQPDESRDAEVRRRINFILAYTSLFFILLLLVICCIVFVIIKNRKNSQLDRPYKMADSL
ncbi:hypothetical protein PMAYCL1PPCAC_21070 [Pristionchus mayeri]|uniref:Uncharacterized protein n=1 Tax=Pristionchus mayeri TaxID=1317129 RepID=A0AAN5CV53_9BILA|nr:hypothetical protein PMAYCL1PPCAC_21070 [Pristionchus mayeri]